MGTWAMPYIMSFFASENNIYSVDVVTSQHNTIGHKLEHCFTTFFKLGLCEKFVDSHGILYIFG